MLPAGAAPGTAAERVGDILPGGGLVGVDDEAMEAMKAFREETTATIEDVKKQLKALDEAKEQTKKGIKGLTGLVIKEAKSAKSGVLSTISRATSGVIGGGIAGGALAAVMLGYKEKDRQRAQKGEVKNVLEATGDALFTGPMKKARNWFYNFQENAQFYYGVGRKEIQATMKQMVDAGYNATEMMEAFDKKLGKVGANTVSLSLGLDKHLNLASGESMKRVISLTQDYGDSLKGAASNVVNLSLAAQQSGAGINKFIDSVMSGSSAVAQYGIDLKEVVSLTSELEKHYTNMGLDKRYAGQLATTAASGIATGIAGFSTGVKMQMAEKMGLGSGYTGLQGLEEGWSRVKEGDKSGFFIQMLDAMRAIQEENVGGASREVQIAFWKQQGLKSEAATTFVDEAAKGPFSRLLVGVEGSEKTLKGLKNAFKTEGEQVSEIQKDQRDLIKGMMAVGQGILQILGGLLGTIILGIRSLPALLEWAINKLPGGDEAKANRIMDKITSVQDLQFQAISDGFDSTSEAGKHFAGTMAEKIVKVFGDQVRVAATADFSGIVNKVEKAEAELADMKAELEDLKTKGLGPIPALEIGTKKQRERAAMEDPERRKEIEEMQRQVNKQQNKIADLVIDEKGVDEFLEYAPEAMGSFQVSAEHVQASIMKSKEAAVSGAANQ